MDLSVFRPVKYRCVNMVALACETDILRSKREQARNQMEASSQEAAELLGKVNAQKERAACIFFRNRAIRLRSDIEKKCAIFADYIDQIQNYI